jgi:hypothetical protein
MRYMKAGGMNELPNEGLQALAKKAPEVVENMGYDVAMDGARIAKMGAKLGLTPDQAKKIAEFGMRVMKSGGMVPSMEDGGMYQYNKELESMGDGGKMYGAGGVKPMKSYGHGGYMK